MGQDRQTGQVMLDVVFASLLEVASRCGLKESQDSEHSVSKTEGGKAPEGSREASSSPAQRQAQRGWHKAARGQTDPWTNSKRRKRCDKISGVY